MKTLKIILTITVFGIYLLPGCSEHTNSLTGYEDISKTNTKSSFNLKQALTLLRRHEGINLVAKGERSVYADADFLFEFDGQHNIVLSYDGFATPDTSCYISSVTISLDNINLHIDIGALYINGHHEYGLGNIYGNRLRIAIMLWHDEPVCNSYATMKISDIKVYSN